MFGLTKYTWCKKMCPSKVQKTVLNHGEWHKAGAVLTGDYLINNIGECASIKTRVDQIDEQNKSVTHSYHEGYIMENYYKTFYSTMQAIPKGDNKGCIIKWSFVYEKMNKDAPEATVYIDFMLAMAKDIDAYLCKG
uniref:Bet v I/Major latex protein domain-containing protein n=1 Tax=Chenopodium quinoa TaxID=63459 RepID=A0A803LBT4_CHEQI